MSHPTRLRPSIPLALAGACLLAASGGCNRNRSPITEESTPPFSFRALDLQQRTSEGMPAWSLTSPEARYDLRSSVARALRPAGVIYAKGKPLYRLAATTGTVINDGAVILLEGEIRLQRLGENPLLIAADRALWLPRESLMRFELRPQVRNLQQRVSAETATLHLDRDLLQLRGDPRLERWSRPLPLEEKVPAAPPEMEGTGKEVDWHPGTGALQGLGPVVLRRRPPGSAPNRAPQVLSAARLEGNSLQQQYTLKGPVQIDDPAERSWFRGGDLLFNTRDQWLSSPVAFQLQRGELQVRGEELRLDGKGSVASIARGCNLQQAGDELRAQSCHWNWGNQTVHADGQVEYRRPQADQITRGQHLDGRLGSDGQVRVSTPGGKVFSQLRVPRGSAAPQPRKPLPRPEPIVF